MFVPVCYSPLDSTLHVSFQNVLSSTVACEEMKNYESTEKGWGISDDRVTFLTIPNARIYILQRSTSRQNRCVYVRLECLLGTGDLTRLSKGQ